MYTKCALETRNCAVSWLQPRYWLKTTYQRYLLKSSSNIAFRIGVFTNGSVGLVKVYPMVFDFFHVKLRCYPTSAKFLFLDSPKGKNRNRAGGFRVFGYLWKSLSFRVTFLFMGLHFRTHKPVYFPGNLFLCSGPPRKTLHLSRNFLILTRSVRVPPGRVAISDGNWLRSRADNCGYINCPLISGCLPSGFMDREELIGKIRSLLHVRASIITLQIHGDKQPESPICRLLENQRSLLFLNRSIPVDIPWGAPLSSSDS